jgi:hypothetical protein
MSFFFSFTKSKNRKAGQVLSVRVGTSERWEKVEKGFGRVDIVQILCTHIC